MAASPCARARTARAPVRRHHYRRALPLCISDRPTGSGVAVSTSGVIGEVSQPTLWSDGAQAPSPEALAGAQFSFERGASGVGRLATYRWPAHGALRGRVLAMHGHNVHARFEVRFCLVNAPLRLAIGAASHGACGALRTT